MGENTKEKKQKEQKEQEKNVLLLHLSEILHLKHFGWQRESLKAL